MFDIFLKNVLRNVQKDTLFEVLDVAVRVGFDLMDKKHSNEPKPEPKPEPNDELEKIKQKNAALDKIQKEYSDIATTYPYHCMIAMIKAFEPGFDIIPYIRTAKTDNDKIQIMNQLLIKINKSTTDKWIESLDLLYRRLSGSTQAETIKRMEELAEVKNVIYKFQSDLNKTCLKQVASNSALLKLL